MRICVFCGSSLGRNPAHTAAARDLGAELVRRDIELVYGGGNVGLMGVIADAVLQAGGRATGVIPRAMVDRELAHGDLTTLHVVGSMHERKALMAQLADGFVALPGGFGTLEEFCEVVTWTQLGVHAKACGLLNVDGYYDGLVAFLRHALDEEFLRSTHFDIVVSATTASEMIERVLHWQPPAVARWIDSKAT